MALEFSARLKIVLRLERPLSSTLVFDHPTLDALATYVETEVLHLAPENEADEASPAEISSRVEELERLGDEEVEAILLRRLQTL